MAPAMTLSSVFNIVSTVKVPPTASRSCETAASVIASFVCDDSMSDTKVENLRPYTRYQNARYKNYCRTHPRVRLLQLRLFAPHRVDRRDDALAHALDCVILLPPARRGWMRYCELARHKLCLALPLWLWLRRDGGRGLGLLDLHALLARRARRSFCFHCQRQVWLGYDVRIKFETFGPAW
jgi:hypothetical protein